MDHLFDKFSKSLAEPVPRREALRRMGAVFAGAVLSPLGLGTACAAKADPCKTFCKCRNKKQQDQCLAACQKCKGDTRRLAGVCGNYTCCTLASCKGVCSDLRSNPNCGACGNDCRVYGQTCCGSYCADLKNDFSNCGSCGHVCEAPGPNEYGACVAGTCVYGCVEGATDCDGICTFVDSDPEHCGACGNVCSDSSPYCNQGVCSACSPGLALCGNACVDLQFDPHNCGGCGNVCAESTPFCDFGACSTCPHGAVMCDGNCIDIMDDPFNCGGCNNQCVPSEYCASGICFGYCIGREYH
jgi:hypothetical protein